jgi:hypothetical protein
MLNIMISLMLKVSANIPSVPTGVAEVDHHSPEEPHGCIGAQCKNDARLGVISTTSSHYDSIFNLSY